MSTIREQVKELRQHASLDDLSSYGRVVKTRELLRRAADTIEALSEKVKAQNRYLLEELEEYRRIGTPDECREAREKQRLKKPEQTGGVVHGIEGINGCVSYVSVQKDYYECPTCESFLGYASDCEDNEIYQCSYCSDCGQAIDWGGNLCQEEKQST